MLTIKVRNSNGVALGSFPFIPPGSWRPIPPSRRWKPLPGRIRGLPACIRSCTIRS
jgi:hypothetical protein